MKGSLTDIEMPLTGNTEHRLLFHTPETSFILEGECVQWIDMYDKRSKGESARKLKKRIKAVFCGVSETEIQAHISNAKPTQRIRPNLSLLRQTKFGTEFRLSLCH